ncbi:MAG: DUF378 domain-containing protein [Candidatus Yanofskybacteria bacterium]|nr:DUF378 domain-containing protein [Candidatus Yanofskybacteria bacterium]
MSLKKVAYALVMVGAINWGLIGILDYNLVNELLGDWPSLVRIIYALVGVSAVYMMAKPHA